jgi:hypothetical protein
MVVEMAVVVLAQILLLTEKVMVVEAGAEAEAEAEAEEFHCFLIITKLHLVQVFH